MKVVFKRLSVAPLVTRLTLRLHIHRIKVMGSMDEVSGLKIFPVIKLIAGIAGVIPIEVSAGHANPYAE